MAGKEKIEDSCAIVIKKEPEEEDITAEAEEDGSEEEEEDELSHQEAMAQLWDGIAEAVVGDPVMTDLPAQITLEEVNSQIALEHGQAMTVNVRRADDRVLPVVVVQNATVLDLKRAIKRHVTLKMSRENGPEHISWRYIWRSYSLMFDGQKLSEDKKPIKEYGIRNRAEVVFLKRLRNK